MSIVSADTVINNVQSLKFDFTNTPRGKELLESDVSGDYIIDVNGNIRQKKAATGSATVSIIGGKEEHVHRKDKEDLPDYYISDEQKSAMHKILFVFAIRNKFNGIIEEGNNDYLTIVAQSAFANYRA